MPVEKKKSAQPTNAGIITDKGGQRFIPESQRADGSTRKAIKIRPGFRPTEDVELYRSRGTEAKSRPRGVVGAVEAEPSPTAASNKNAKRREARKKAKEAGDDGEQGADEQAPVPEPPEEEPEVADPEVEKAKKARALKKKLRQARELQDKKEGGGSLLPEQIAKVIKINELVRELEALGFGADGEPENSKGAITTEAQTKAGTEG